MVLSIRMAYFDLVSNGYVRHCQLFATVELNYGPAAAISLLEETDTCDIGLENVPDKNSHVCHL